jgi:SOS response regulatory protein OraA/RecX
MRVTSLRAASRGRVAVELDGAPWRTFPLDVVLRAGLTRGDLTRDQLRTLARELRRSRALTTASRALRTRDLSTRALEDRLTRAGHARAARHEALGTVVRAGLVNDERLAHGRAAALAGRGYGDAAIRSDLERRGIEGSVAGAAVAELPPERERAAQVVAERGGGVATARLLIRRGFAPETAVAAAGVEEA